MKESLEEYLSELNLLNKDEINDVLYFFEYSKLKKGDFFIRENKICDKISFIIKGGAKGFSSDSDGNENITCFKFENQFITSYESFVLKQTSKKSIQALEDCEVLTISYEDLNLLFAKISAFQIISKKLIEQEFIDKENYLFVFNNKSAKEKYSHLLMHAPSIAKRVSAKDISSYLGITQRTLTRAKKEIMHPKAL
jgi:CRP-like cAMP-binding protein